MRRSVNASARTVVKTSVPLDPGTWARLCALAATRQVGRGELAASLLVRALRGVQIRDGTGEADQVEQPAQ